LVFVLALRIASFINLSSISMLVRIIHLNVYNITFYVYRIATTLARPRPSCATPSSPLS
jgi:hypothetical protein